MKKLASVAYFLSWISVIFVFLSVCWLVIAWRYRCAWVVSQSHCSRFWQLSGEDLLGMFLPLLISVALVFIFSSLHDRIVNKKDGLTLSGEAFPKMVNRLWYIIPCVFLIAFFIWKSAPDWLNPRPSTLATSVYNHKAVPVVRNVSINGFRIAHLGTSDLNESGPVPYQNDWDNDLYFEVTWIELFNEQAWHAEFTVPIEILPTIRDGRSARVNITIGAGGDLLVWVFGEEFRRLSAENRGGEITKEHLEPDVIYELCGDRLADDEPRRQALFAGMDEWAVSAMEHQHNSWMNYPHVRRQGESFPPTSRCTSDWSLSHE